MNDVGTGVKSQVKFGEGKITVTTDRYETVFATGDGGKAAAVQVAFLHQEHLLSRREIERLRSGLEAIVGRDPSRPGPQAAVAVTTTTLVDIAKQALGLEGK